MSRRGDMVTIVCTNHERRRVVGRFERGESGWVLTRQAKAGPDRGRDKVGRISLPGTVKEPLEKPMETLAAFGVTVETIDGKHVDLTCMVCWGWGRSLDGAGVAAVLDEAVARGFSIFSLRELAYRLTT